MWSEVKASVTQSCPTLCNLMGLSPSRLLCPWNSPGKNTGVGIYSLLQGIFLTQGLNPSLLHSDIFFTILVNISHQFCCHLNEHLKWETLSFFIGIDCYLLHQKISKPKYLYTTTIEYLTLMGVICISFYQSKSKALIDKKKNIATCF